MDKIVDRNSLNKYFIGGTFLVLTIISLFIIQGFILSIFIGAIIAYAIYPLYASLIKWTKSERTSAILMSALAVVVILLLGLTLIPEVIGEITNVYNLYKNGLPSGSLDFLKCEAESTEMLCSVFGFFLSNLSHESINSLIVTFAQPISIDFFKNLPGLVLQATIVIFSAAYFLHNGKNIVQKAIKDIPLRESNKKVVFKRIDDVLKAVIYGNIVTAFIEGVIVTIFFFALGIKLGFIAGIGTMFFALIPPLGAMLVWGPAVVALFLLGQYLKAILLLILCASFLGFIDNIGRPMIIGSRVKLSPFWILLGVLGGLATFGFAGIIIGPLVLSLFVTSLTILGDEMAAEQKEKKDG